MRYSDQEDGMGFVGAVPTKQEKQYDSMKSEIITIAKALAQYERRQLCDLDSYDLSLIGNYARRLKKVAISNYDRNHKRIP